MVFFEKIVYIYTKVWKLFNSNYCTVIPPSALKTVFCTLRKIKKVGIVKTNYTQKCQQRKQKQQNWGLLLLGE